MKIIEFIRFFFKKIQLNKAAQHFPKKHLLTISALATALLVGAVATHSAQNTSRLSHTLTLKIAATAPEDLTNDTISPNPSSDISWHVEKIKSGDSLSVLFNRAGLSDTVLQGFLTSNKAAKQLTQIYPGQKISFNINPQGRLDGLLYQKSRLHSIEFLRSDKGFITNDIVVQPDIRPAYREATIINSLFLAGTSAGMEQNLIMELASIFGWDIDFAMDIRANDSFRVLYEEKFVNGEKIGNGAILAAEFINQNQAYRAVRYTNKEGESSYFTPEGKSMKKAFLRTPVDFARISSHFNLRRKHPILNKIRAHKGTDYAAPTGTPIKAAGNGKVIFAGTKGGYGRTVIIRHGQSYQTLYAHMHKYGRGIRTGKKVKQGQVIGYVGKSGLATGPHLHYEFYKNGSVRNPVKVELPKAKSIAKSTLKDFKLQTNPLVTQLDQLNRKTQIALSGNEQPLTTN